MYGHEYKKISAKTVPNCLLVCLACCGARSAKAVVVFLGDELYMDNRPMKNVLGITMTPREQTIRDMVDKMKITGHLPPPK